MAALIYQLEVKEIGEFVAHYLRENKMILFAAPVPADISAYCVVHCPGKERGMLSPGQIMQINHSRYDITAVGDAANNNLAQLGHITLNFDGADRAELPGMVHLSGASPRFIQPGDRILFIDR